MKKILSVLLVSVLALALTACQNSHTQPEPTAAPTTEPSAPVTAPAESAAEPSALPETAGEPAETVTPMELAESCVGKSAEDLFALVGEPLSSDYAPSCLGSGEDGILEYAEFLVYTYRDGDMERVDTILPR